MVYIGIVHRGGFFEVSKQYDTRCNIEHVISADAQTDRQTDKRGKHKAILGTSRSRALCAPGW